MVVMIWLNEICKIYSARFDGLRSHMPEDGGIVLRQEL